VALHSVRLITTSRRLQTATLLQLPADNYYIYGEKKAHPKIIMKFIIGNNVVFSHQRGNKEINLSTNMPLLPSKEQAKYRPLSLF
jgi:hypothetical protein